ncbi:MULTISPECIES: hypothetical protein [Streptomyces]|nr:MULTISPECIES: hypothetical protein [Streptomyces]
MTGTSADRRFGEQRAPKIATAGFDEKACGDLAVYTATPGWFTW